MPLSIDLKLGYGKYPGHFIVDLRSQLYLPYNTAVYDNSCMIDLQFDNTIF